MLKVAKRFLAVMLVFVLSLTPVQILSAQAYVPEYESMLIIEDSVSSFDMLVAEHGMEFVQNYTRTLNMLNDFIESLPMNRSGELMFPSYFGGAYIDCSGNAVLLMVSTPSTNALGSRYVAYRPKSAHVTQMQGSEGVTVREVEFAYTDLWATIHFLNDLSQYVPELFASVTAFGWYLDVIGNRVVVELYDFTEDTTNLFREVILDAPLLAFAQSEGLVELNSMIQVDYIRESYYSNYEYNSIVPFNTFVADVGDTIEVWRGGVRVASGSIGYRANLGGARGFITSAHIGLPLINGDVIYLRNRSRRIGRVANANHVRLTGVDAAFITLDAGIEIRNSPRNIALSDRPIIHVFTGQEIASVGAITGFRFGRVSTPSWSGLISIMGGQLVYSVSNAVILNLAGGPGDSGGIVFCFLTGDVMGIVTGGNADAGLAISSRATEINRVLGSWLRG